MRGARLADLAWTEVRSSLEGRVAVLPIGAAAKEHGPHLPMDTDYRTAEALGRLAAERERVLVWPTVGYGHYPAFVEYAGSTSVGEATFAALLRDLVGDLARAGAAHVLLWNTGISTIRSVEAAVEHAPIPAAALHVYRGARYLDAVAAVCVQERGGHADEAETSVMLHLEPACVRLENAVAWTRAVPPGRWSPDDPASPRYAPHGVYGDPTLATADKGARLVDAMLDDLASALAALRAP